MDYTDGEIKESICGSSQERDMLRILEHFASFTSQKPGSLTGGQLCGPLFGESDSPAFDSVGDLEVCFNERLLESTTRISLPGQTCFLAI